MTAQNLVIVESPAKAKTIEKILGSDFMVKSSFGHIRDLAKARGTKDSLLVEGVTEDFTPLYEVSDDKKKTVTELKKLAKNRTVWLASDEDREGEAIAWHLCEALGLDPKETKRIVFHEITKSAITEAVKKPRTVNADLVNAQQARRVLDRIVGFKLSPVLWQKVQRGLSAGRVQSVAVRLIVDRERDIRDFAGASDFRVVADLMTDKKEAFKAELGHRFKTTEESESFLQSLVGKDFIVQSVEARDSQRTPSAPFTTSTLQQEASRHLGMSVKKTMMTAQRLYEQGLITYMRTDSVSLSKQAIAQAQAVVTQEFGADYSVSRKYQTRSSGAQEAHEAIRPTDLSRSQVSISDADQGRLYQLIYKRTLASQMANAKLEKTVATIVPADTTAEFLAKGEVVIFPGFLKLYQERNDEESEDSSQLPPLKTDQVVVPQTITAKQTFSRPPARYTEASLVKKLESEGIGRPSTYAPTISTVQDRGYIEKKNLDAQQRDISVLTLTKETVEIATVSENFGAEKNKLFPTAIGEVVTDFLSNQFRDIIDYGFTAKMESSFDDIADGKTDWKKVLEDFYKKFAPTVELAKTVDRQQVLSVRELGIDPETQEPVFARIGRYGPMVQIGNGDKEKDIKPKFASLQSGMTLDGITLEQALECFQTPENQVLGTTEDGESIELLNGRFGWYLKVGDLNVSLPKDRRDRKTKEVTPGIKPEEVTEEVARRLVREKKEQEANKYVQEWKSEGISLLRGPYGIYIKSDTKGNVAIPKDQKETAEKLTLKECQAIVEKAPSKKGRRR